MPDVGRIHNITNICHGNVANESCLARNSHVTQHRLGKPYNIKRFYIGLQAIEAFNVALCVEKVRRKCELYGQPIIIL